MQSYPDEYELIALFEAEPVRTRPDLDWPLGTMTFTARRGHERVECGIDIGYADLSVRFFSGVEERLHLQFHDVERLRVDNEDGVEALRAFSAEDTGVRPLVLELRPTLRVAWGTEGP